MLTLSLSMTGCISPVMLQRAGKISLAHQNPESTKTTINNQRETIVNIFFTLICKSDFFFMFFVMDKKRFKEKNMINFQD